MLPGLLLLALMAPPDVRDITVAPGEVLRVTLAGSGRPVVLVPGMLGSAFAFRKLIPPLDSAGYQVIVIEPLGTGHSSRPGSADYSLGAQAGRLAAVLDSLGVRGAPVLGHSLGVSMVLRLALRRPDLVGAIVASNGGPEEEAATRGVRRAARFAFLLRIFGGRDAMRRELVKGLRETAGDPRWLTAEVIDAYAAGSADDPGATLEVLKGMARARDEPLAPRLGEVQVPVRLLVGGAPRGSGLKAAHAALMRNRLPRFAADTVPGAGLHLHEERPDVVVGAVLAAAALSGQAR